MRAKKDLTGMTFGKLTVIGDFGDRTKDGKILWRCKCDCGNEHLVRGYYLLSGHATSCGCRRGEFAKEKFTTHGDTGSRLWRIWTEMKNRCHSRNPNYGGRGISVCEEWMDFSAFKEWALSNGYRDDLTIDRRDVNGNYCPDNCRWLTMKEQQNNRRNNLRVEFNGEVHTLSEWSDILGVNYKALWRRFHRTGRLV